MNGPLRVLLGSLAAAACILPPASGQAAPDDPSGVQEQPADSLVAAIDRLEPADLTAALAWLDTDANGGGFLGGGAGRWRGAARLTATGGRWDLGRRDGHSEVRLRGGDRTAMSGGASLEAGGARVLVGDVGLHAGYGLLLSGAGRWAGLSSPGGGQGGIQAGLHAGAAERRALRGVVAALNAGPGEIIAWRGRARDAGTGVRTGVALAHAGARGHTALAFMTEAAGRGGSLSAVWTGGADAGGDHAGGALALSGESSVWSERAGGPRRTAWAVSGRWRAGRRASAEVQVAVAQPGSAPRSAQRPAALTADVGRGWLIRLQRRRESLSLVAAYGVAEQDGWSEGAPRLTAVRRWSLDADGGDARRRWGASLSGRSVVQRGWAGRMPWLPSAGESAQDTWRAASWVEAGSGPWQSRLVWRTVRTVVHDGTVAGDDDRSAVSLSLGAAPPVGWGWRFVQVWAWGGGADLVSVEAPAPGLLLPRHWGRWRDERTLGVHWRRAGAQASVCAAYRRPQLPGEAADYEFRAAAVLGWQGW